MRIRQLISGIRKTCDAAHLPFLAQPAAPQAPRTPSPHDSPHCAETPPIPRRADASPRPFRPNWPVRIPAPRPGQGSRRRQPRSLALRSDPPRLPRAVSARSPASPRAALTTSRRIRRRSGGGSAGSLAGKEGWTTRQSQVSMWRGKRRGGVSDQRPHVQPPLYRQCRSAGRRVPESSDPRAQTPWNALAIRKSPPDHGLRKTAGRAATCGSPRLRCRHPGPEAPSVRTAFSRRSTLTTTSASQESPAPFPGIRRWPPPSLTFPGMSCPPSPPSGLLLAGRPRPAVFQTPRTRPVCLPVPSAPAPAIGERQDPRHPRDPTPMRNSRGERLRRWIR